MLNKSKKNIKNLVLIGFRGCGKSTIAKKISNKTAYRFVDLDQEIEVKTKKTIQQITNNGQDWEKFRLLETNTILRLFGFQKQVIALGGGFGVNDVLISNPKVKSLNNISDKVSFENYGQLQSFILKQRPENLKIYLKLSEIEILERLLKIYKKEEKIGQRPSLSNYKTFNFEAKIERWFVTRADLLTDQELVFRLKNDLKNFLNRKQKYEEIADLVVTNNKASVEKMYRYIANN